MKLRWPWLIQLVAAVSAFFIWCWLWTTRLRVASVDGREHPVDPASERFVYCFWHEGILAALASRVQVHILISQHADGELIASIAQRLGYGVIRGSSTRGGAEAMLAMIRDQEGDRHLGITPDGPRGPRRELQPGAILVASLTGLPIVPVGFGYSSAWRCDTWDQFAVPLPGSTLTAFVGSPIPIPPDLDRAGIELHRQRVEAALLLATEQAEEWAGRIAREGQTAPPPQPAALAEQRRAA